MTAADRDGGLLGIVLAAGGGERFGGPKALARIDGEVFVERAIRTLRAGGCDEVMTVLGAAASEVVAQTDLDRTVVIVAEDWHEGMSASLRTALRTAEDGAAAAALIALVDQPWITSACVRRLRAAWESGASAVVATYDGEARNPVLLDRCIWPAVVESLVGDAGARGWLRSHPDLVVPVECGDISDASDVDYPGDLSTR